jgi:hypothetical protein
MMKNLSSLFKTYLTLLASVLTLSACGGGNGPAGDPLGPGGGTDKGKIELSMKDPSGNSTHIIPLNSTLTVFANVVDGNGDAVQNTTVTFTTNTGTIATFSPLVGTALTDNNGDASIVLIPTGTPGADQLKATATVNNNTITATTGFCYGSSCTP